MCAGSAVLFQACLVGCGRAKLHACISYCIYLSANFCGVVARAFRRARPLDATGTALAPDTTMAMLATLLAGSSAWMVGQGPLTRSATAATAGRARIAELQMDEGAVAASRPEAFVGSSFGSSAMGFRQGTLVLEDGTRLRGVSFGFEESIAGEHLHPIHHPLLTRRRPDWPRALLTRCVGRGRRARLHHGDGGVPGDPHRPLVQGSDPHAHQPYHR